MLAFVILGAMITLAGPDSGLREQSGNLEATLEKDDQDKSYAKSSKELVRVEVGSTG